MPEAQRGTRLPLPARRVGHTQKLRLNGSTLYIHTGHYENGALGEIFVTLSREGSSLRSIMECFSKSISIGLQYGVPLEVFVRAFTNTRFEPAGIVEGHPAIKLSSSVMDLIFRDLGISYLGQADLGNIQSPPPR